MKKNKTSTDIYKDIEDIVKMWANNSGVRRPEWLHVDDPYVVVKKKPQKKKPKKKPELTSPFKIEIVEK
jgi:hypothetical protein